MPGGAFASRRWQWLAGALVATALAGGSAAWMWSVRIAATPAPQATAAVAGTAAYDELERHLKRQPRDGRALVFKARLDAQAGRHDLAVQGYAAATSVATRVARDPGVWVEYAEARAMAQDGKLAGEPELLLERALALDARHAQALDLLGSAAWERGQHAQAAALWRRVLAQTAPGTERHGALVRAIDRAEMLAKVSLPPPS